MGHHLGSVLSELSGYWECSKWPGRNQLECVFGKGKIQDKFAVKWYEKQTGLMVKELHTVEK